MVATCEWFPSHEQFPLVIGYTPHNLATTNKPWSPVSSEGDFDLASWFVRNKVAKCQSDLYLAEGLGGMDARSFRLAYTIWQHLDEWELFGDYLVWTKAAIDDRQHATSFYSQNVIDHVCFWSARLRRDQVWSTRVGGNTIAVQSDYTWRCIRQTGGEIHRYEICPDICQCTLFPVLTHYCISWENTLPARSTVVPIIGLVDQTYLTNVWGNKKAWPVSMTLGNILSPRRNSPAKMLVLLVALLPIEPKLSSESTRGNET